MILITHLLLSFAGCACLALAMNRHGRDVFATLPGAGRKSRLRVAGSSSLVASLALAVAGHGAGVGCVEWTCGVGLSALTLVLLLSYSPRAVPGLTATAFVLTAGSAWFI